MSWSNRARLLRSPRNELELITEEELSRLLKITPRHLYNWRMRGKIPYFKLGRVVRYRVGEVAMALESRKIG